MIDTYNDAEAQREAEFEAGLDELLALRAHIDAASHALTKAIVGLAGSDVVDEVEEEQPLVVYLAHPVGGDVENNLKKARAWVEWIYRTMPHVVVLSQWILDCELLDDANPEERAQGFARNKHVVALADELWAVGGHWSNGMTDEKAMAEEAGVEIVDATSWTSPPDGMVVEFAHAEAG